MYVVNGKNAPLEDSDSNRSLRFLVWTVEERKQMRMDSSGCFELPKSKKRVGAMATFPLLSDSIGREGASSTGQALCPMAVEALAADKIGCRHLTRTY